MLIACLSDSTWRTRSRLAPHLLTTSSWAHISLQPLRKVEQISGKPSRWEPDVCYDLYQTGYSTCSWEGEQVSGKPRHGALGGCQVDPTLPQGNLQDVLVPLRGEGSSEGLYWCWYGRGSWHLHIDVRICVYLSRGEVSWQSKIHKCVALSMTEAEYIAMNEAKKEMLWLKQFLEDLGQNQGLCLLYYDSKSAMDLSKNATYHGWTKHIAKRYH